jgi:predicted nucleic acid-binding protein
MNNGILTRTGRLKKKLLPAVYLDTSVVIDYWATEGLERDDAALNGFEKHEWPLVQVLREIMRSERRIEKVVEIRKKVTSGTIRATPVVSPLALLELVEWYAEAAFRQIASQASGASFIRSKSKKDIGDYLKRALELHLLENEELKAEKRDEVVGLGSTGLETLMSETWLDRSFASVHGLKGLLLADLTVFHLPMDGVWKEPSAYAYLQIGLADIMHILAAQHLGCEYIASFDSDFKRVKEIITEETGISVLTSPEEVLRVI